MHEYNIHPRLLMFISVGRSCVDPMGQQANLLESDQGK